MAQGNKDRMADNKLEQTADEFRSLVRQAAEQGRLNPAGEHPGIDADAVAAAVEARLVPAITAATSAEPNPEIAAMVRSAVAEAMAEHAPPSAQIDPALVQQLEAAAKSLDEKAGSGDVLMHLRNVLPGQMRQEMHQQSQNILQRIGGLEYQVAALHADNSWSRELARALLTGIVVAIVLFFAVIFERQIQDWGRDSVYPLFGISIKEAVPSTPRLANPSPPTETR